MKKYGVSTYEMKVAAFLDIQRIPNFRFRYICFECGHVGSLKVKFDKFGNLEQLDHAYSCEKCLNQFGKKPFEYAEPDFIIKSKNGKSFILAVNGYHHTKKKFVFKDETQISFFATLGYPVLIITTEDMDELPEMVEDCIKFCYEHMPKLSLDNNRYTLTEYVKDKKMLEEV